MGKTTQNLAAMLALSREAAVGVENGVIVFMNPSAVRAAGGDSTGKPASCVIPEHILAAGTGEMVASAVMFGKSTTISVTSFGEIRIYMLSFPCREGTPSSEVPMEARIRSLLANLRLAADRMELRSEELGDPILRRNLQVLERCYYQLRRLMMNLTAARAIERGELPFLPSRVNLAEYCGGIARTVEALSVYNDVDFSYECSGNCEIMADLELLQQLMLNLLSNSLMHARDGGHIKISASRCGSSVIVSVDDDGEGIPPEILPTVFTRWRENISLTEAAEGAGMGLGVARGIAERHGGALLIESRRGVGTKVRVVLPVESAEPTATFHSDGSGYEPQSLDPALTYLSVYLPAEFYGPEYRD